MKQKKQHDAKAVDRKLGVGERVFIQNYALGDKWLPGVILRQTGPVSFRVALPNGQEKRVHQDQVRKRMVDVGVLPEDLVGTQPDEVALMVALWNHLLLCPRMYRLLKTLQTL